MRHRAVARCALAAALLGGAAASAWELNVGVGAGLTAATSQHLIVKAIVGRAF